VSLKLDGDEWVIDDVLGLEPFIDGSYIDSQHTASADERRRCADVIADADSDRRHRRVLPALGAAC
jgi:hypothetical protein